MFDIAPNKTRVAVVKYSTQVEAEFNFKSYSTKNEVLNSIDMMRYAPGGTKTAEALEFTMNNIFSEAEGARRGSAKVR